MKALEIEDTLITAELSVVVEPVNPKPVTVEVSWLVEIYPAVARPWTVLANCGWTVVAILLPIAPYTPMVVERS